VSTAEKKPLPGTDAVTQVTSDEPKVASQKIFHHELVEGKDAIERPAGRLFFSGVAGGLEIGFSLFLMGVVRTLTDGRWSGPVVELLSANMYSFGFVLVILGRSEFFTEQTSLAVLPVLNGEATVKGLLGLWVNVLVANLIGATISAGLIAVTGPSLGVISPRAMESIAQSVVNHPPLAIVLSAIFAGWLMGLLSWVVAAARDTISQIVVVWMVTAAIGLGHLHHAILGSVEVLAGLFSSRSVSLGDFGHFLLWTTLGNIVGGSIFVAILKYSHARPLEGTPHAEGVKKP
jgi:formate-nitrite transporter family protein